MSCEPPPATQRRRGLLGEPDGERAATKQPVQTRVIGQPVSPGLLALPQVRGRPSVGEVTAAARHGAGVITMALSEYKAGTRFSRVIGRTTEQSSPAWPQPSRAMPGAPNVLMIVLDDTGYGQLGCFGSPI